jgi:upstream activation factor subunit UAF30
MATKNTSGSKGGGKGLAAEVTPSADLAAIVGSNPMPRSEITKKVWDYIKANGLQDQQNKRMINADDKLRTIFGGKDQVSMFEMTALVNKHLPA